MDGGEDGKGWDRMEGSREGGGWLKGLISGGWLEAGKR